MKNNYYLFFLLLTVTSLHAQVRQLVSGNVFYENEPVGDVVVANRTSKKTTKTDNNGFFSIEVQPADEVVVYDEKNRIQPLFRVISLEDQKSSYLLFNVQEATTQLEEMFIDQRVTTESLGLANLKHAPQHSQNADLLGLVSLLVTSLRKNKYKEEVVKPLSVDEKMFLIESKVTASRLTDFFQIPKENLGRFMYYLIEDSNFMQIVEKGSKELFEIELIQKVAEFKKSFP